MSNETTATVIRDNHFCGSVGDFLRPHLKIGANLSVVSAYFTIYAYQALKAELDAIGHMNFLFGDPAHRDQLKAWFDRLWNDADLVADVKQDVLQYLAQIYQNHPPEFIYYKTLYHIFEKYLGDARKTDEDLGATTLFDTEIWKTLFDFQKDGAKGAINKILAHNGCILADSVGLGKTYEALSVNETGFARRPSGRKLCLLAVHVAALLSIMAKL